jgi:hypothetical protein
MLQGMEAVRESYQFHGACHQSFERCACGLLASSRAPRVHTPATAYTASQRERSDGARNLQDGAHRTGGGFVAQCNVSWRGSKRAKRGAR